MKAVVLEGKRNMIVSEIPTPEPDGHNVIIKVNKCGICGSDAHFYYESGDRFQGMILGHEYSGTVMDPGCRSDLKAGDRVFTIVTGCGQCDLCKAGLMNLCKKLDTSGYLGYGAYAEYKVAWPEYVFKLPDEISFTEAAMFEPLAVAVHAVKQFNVKFCSKVLVFGRGIIGAACAVIARKSGASFVALVETNMARAQDALDRGECDVIFNARDKDLVAKLKAANGGRGYDVICECSGDPSTLTTALRTIYPGGTIGIVGVATETAPAPLSLAVFGDIRIQGSYAYTKADLLDSLEAVQRKMIDLTHYANEFYSLEQTPQVFTDLAHNKIKDVKAIIDVAGTGRE